MARPKGKLFALLAIFAAIGIVTATGAFTTVQADRTMEATVNDDTSAILGLEPYDGPNGNGGAADDASDGYANLDDGVLQLNLGGYSGGSAQNQGLNYNATTEFDNVFNISNNGAADFTYYIERDGQHQNASNTVVFYQGAATTGTNVTAAANEGASGAGTLTTGGTHTISIAVDLEGIDASDVTQGEGLLDGITIHANSV